MYVWMCGCVDVCCGRCIAGRRSLSTGVFIFSAGFISTARSADGLERKVEVKVKSVCMCVCVCMCVYMRCGRCRAATEAVPTGVCTVSTGFIGQSA